MEKNLGKLFGEKEWRIYDIWLGSGSESKKPRGKKYLKETLQKMGENLNEVGKAAGEVEDMSRSLFQVEVAKASMILEGYIFFDEAGPQKR